MLKRELLDTALIPGGGELRFYRRGNAYTIEVVGASALMSSDTHGSEEALAELACARLTDRSTARVLIGGLGMGFTLAAALRQLGPKAELIVAELVPEVIRWNRGPLGACAGDPLRDPRTTVFEGDVARIVMKEFAAYDAILLDVDNGPDALTHPANHRLYSMTGLKAARAALRPKGVLAVWSSSPDRHFAKRLGMSGFTVEEIRVPAHGTKGLRHTIWLATSEPSSHKG